MSDIHYTTHPSPGRFGSALDPRCTACGQDISPNDAEIAERGILWVKSKPYHPSCFEHHPTQLRKRIAALEDALRWTLPMAKGYAAAHRVGDNEGKVAHAERVLQNETQE